MTGGRSIGAVVLCALAIATTLTAVPDRSAAALAPDAVQIAVIGDHGSGNADAAAVAALVHAAAPDVVATVGDNVFHDVPLDESVGRLYSDFIGAYHGAYGPGSEVNRFFPALGNHDLLDGGKLPAYLAYFTLPGPGAVQAHPSGNERYYDVVQGPVHLFVVDSHSSEPDGDTQGSRQATWLRRGLATSTARWDVVLFHHPPYTSWSLSPGNDEDLQWPFEAWGADLVLSGHVHTYERIVRDDDRDGEPLTYVVDGLGGQTPHEFRADPVGGSQVRYNAGFGALFLTATATQLVGVFRTVDGITRDGFTLSDTAPRPDLRVRRAPDGPLRGDDVYDATGAGQAVGARTAPGDTNRSTISVQNDAAFPEVLRLRGTATTGGFSVHYRVGGIDVTPAVTAGTYVTPVLEPGEALPVHALVTPGDGTRPGSRLLATVAARSTTHPTIRDAVTVLTIRA